MLYFIALQAIIVYTMCCAILHCTTSYSEKHALLNPVIFELTSLIENVYEAVRGGNS